MAAAAAVAPIVPEPEPGPFDGWTAIVVPALPVDRGHGSVDPTNPANKDQVTIVLLDDGSFMAAYRRGRPS
jgi:hypothetical protein